MQNADRAHSTQFEFVHVKSGWESRVIESANQFTILQSHVTERSTYLSIRRCNFWSMKTSSWFPSPLRWSVLRFSKQSCRLANTRCDSCSVLRFRKIRSIAPVVTRSDRLSPFSPTLYVFLSRALSLYISLSLFLFLTSSIYRSISPTRSLTLSFSLFFLSLSP